MLKMRRSQAGLQSLSVYIFAVIIVFLVAYGLYMLGIFSPERPKAAVGFDNFQPIDWRVTGENSAIPRTFHMIITNKDPRINTINYVKFYDTDRRFCGEAAKHHLEILKYGEEIDVGGILYKNCTDRVGEQFTYIVDIGYTSRTSGFNHTDMGRLLGKFESSKSGPTFSGWEHSWYGSDMSTLENSSRLGSYAGSCPPSVPPSGITWVSGGAPLRWELPVGCAAGECHGVGESQHCIQNCSYMAHGWLKASVTSPREAKGHGIWLGGNAVCNNTFTYYWLKTYYNSTPLGVYNCTVNIDHFICINDDLYFFVNGQQIGFSGLSYHAYKCDECGPTVGNTDWWCVPPIDLTQSANFKWDEPNEIYILTEDWCTSGGIGEMDFDVE